MFSNADTLNILSYRKKRKKEERNPQDMFYY